MPSKDVTDRIKMAHSLTAIIDHLTQPTVEGLSELLSTHLRPGEELPALDLTRRLMGRLVMARLQVMIAAGEIDDHPSDGDTLERLERGRFGREEDE